MSLQTAFNTTRSGLFASAAQTAIVSRNIASANQAGYVRRTVSLEALYDGVRVGDVARAADQALQRAALSATSDHAMHTARLSAYDKLQSVFGDPQSEQSPSALAASLRAALIGAAAQPQDAASAQTAIGAAKDFARSLNSAQAAIQTTRGDLDAAMSDGVSRLNKLLVDFDKANTEIVRGKAAGVDANDAMDQRDALVAQISQLAGVTATIGADGGMALYADGGATLYQGGPRAVAMTPTQPLIAGRSGGAVSIDGVAVTGPNATMPLRSGALAGLAQARDVDAPRIQAQLDEIARGAIAAFKESDMSGASPDRTGLFAWAGAPALPAQGAAGLAGSIAVDPAVDPSSGGDWTKLRDGGVGGAAYVVNASGGAGYADRYSALAAGLDAPQAFDPAAGLNAQDSVIGFATQSAAGFAAARQSASDAADRTAALSDHAQTLLNAASGVSMDDQMAQMLDLERSYQSSAKLLNAIGQMYQNLFDAVH